MGLEGTVAWRALEDEAPRPYLWYLWPSEQPLQRRPQNSLRFPRAQSLTSDRGRGLPRWPRGQAMGHPSWRKGWEHVGTSRSRGRCGALSGNDGLERGVEGKEKRCR